MKRFAINPRGQQDDCELSHLLAPLKRIKEAILTDVCPVVEIKNFSPLHQQQIDRNYCAPFTDGIQRKILRLRIITDLNQ